MDFTPMLEAGKQPGRGPGKLKHPRFVALLEALVEFAEAREQENLHKGIGWFVDTGIPFHNSQPGNKNKQLPTDISANALRSWLRRYDILNKTKLLKAFKS